MNGKLICCIAAVRENEPVFSETSLPFEAVVSVGGVTADSVIQSAISITAVSYSIGDNGIELRCNMLMQGSMYICSSSQVIKQAEINENECKKKDDEYTLKLYFADSNEDIWNIAKRYNTSAAAIEAENEVTDGKASGLLLIPIV